MDPSIQKEEEAKLAQKENDVKLKAILEGLLFLVGDDGLTVEQASKSMDISTKKAEQLFDALQKEYVDDSRGFEIERYGSRYRFLSKAFVHEAAKKLFSIDKISKLSNAALETLAIIAYKQPITRVEIEEIRGVGADVMIRKLEARGLIKEEGRSDAPGRPFLYSVTDEFMDAFKLLSLDELPDLPEFNKDNNDDLFHS
ncbi:MAG: SMC-Scp complex subunit ScpB [Erysipelotrichaceae bacterium]|nr:SMC-Scp complex subunit ScpB [Erysipelotrichaceae bacterium]MDD7057509.1 SMC-Scp complex subunit ScpB [Erysipelotrichaceae bacterium]